jgi:GNAT superfamily N-acetyltransferase
MLDITVRLLDASDLHRDALKYFNRHQVTKRVRYKENDTYLYKEDHFVDDWDEQKKQKVIGDLLQCIAGNGIVAGAYHKDRLIGFANVESKFFGSSNEYLELPYIHLSKEYRGLGIGRQLLALCCEKAKEKGAAKLYIAAHPSEESQQFYLRMGCVPAAEVNEEILAREPLDIQLEIEL